jgi:chemotaxis protein histidine kinase CheA
MTTALAHPTPTRLRWTALACVLSLVAPGCMTQVSAPVVIPDADQAFAEPERASVDTEQLAALDTREVLARAHFGSTRSVERDVYEFDDAPAKPKPKPPETPVDVAPPPTEAPPLEDQVSPAPKHGRQIIYTASLGIGVYDLQRAMVAAEALPERFGGWIHMRTEGQVIMRLPAASLRKAMDELGELGIVQSRTLQAEDVTTEYVDLESRIKVLQDTQAQLLALLEKAKTVEEALHVRRALDDVTLELEAALGRMRQLTNLISFSTLTVYLYELGPTQPLPSSNDPFPWVDELGVETTEWR